jgi:hypothetical protein
MNLTFVLMLHELIPHCIFPSKPHMLQRVAYIVRMLLESSSAILKRPWRGSIRWNSVECPILVQRNHGIICRCVRQTGKEAHSMCLTSELPTAATGNHFVGEGYMTG